MRVATYNIHHGVGLDGRLDLDRLAKVVEQLGADVVGLQEVDRNFGRRSGRLDQAGWLAERLGMEVAYGPNIDLDPDDGGGLRRQYGSAILTRHPLERTEHALLPCTEGCEQRGLTTAHVQVEGRPVRVYATHLEQSSRHERRRQAEQIAATIARDTGPAVLVGDLNATPWSREVRTLTGRLVDAWRVVGDGGGRTHRADRPRRRIDYVLHTPDLTPWRAHVVQSDASDHLPVVVDLLLPAGGKAD